MSTAHTGGSINLPLTERQVEVLRAAAEGETRTETAGRLLISVETVKDHRRWVLFRLRARNLAHAVHLAHRRGYLP